MTKKVAHYIVDDKSNKIIVYNTRYLTEKELADIKFLKELNGYKVVLEDKVSDDQKAHRDETAKKDKYYYLGGGDEKKTAVITDKNEQEYFKTIMKHPSKEGGGFFKAKAWWDNQDLIAQECGYESWKVCTKTQKYEIIDWFYTVKVKNGKIVK